MNDLLLGINHPYSQHYTCYKERTAHGPPGAQFDFLVPSSDLFRILVIENELAKAPVHNVELGLLHAMNEFYR